MRAFHSTHCNSAITVCWRHRKYLADYFLTQPLSNLQKFAYVHTHSFNLEFQRKIFQWRSEHNWRPQPPRKPYSNI